MKRYWMKRMGVLVVSGMMLGFLLLVGSGQLGAEDVENEEGENI